MNKRTQAIVLGLMCLILTIEICVQIKTVNNNIKTSKNKELNSLKTQVLKIKEKYNESYQKLINVQEDLEKVREKVSNNDEQLKDLEEKIKRYNILLGTTDVKGPGVCVVLSNADTSSLIDSRNLVVTDIDILEMVNELKNAGAEAIEVNGQRIVPNTSICYDGNIILTNGKKISSPITLNAIGLTDRMITINRTGGYLEWLKDKKHIKTVFKEQKEINMKKYIGVTNFKYAKTIK